MPLAPGSSRNVISHNISEMIHSGYPQKQAVAASLSNARRHPRAFGGSNQMPISGMGGMTSMNRLPPQNRTMPPIISQFGQPAMGMPSAMPMMAGSTSPQMHMANGGNIPQFAMGGFPDSAESNPWYTKQEARNATAAPFHGAGMFSGSAPGRSDTLPRDVPANSHVIPADVVAAIGQGNSLSGGNVLEGMFHSLPFGITGRAHMGRPMRMPSAPRPMAPESTGGRKKDHGQSVVPIVASSGEFLVHPDGVYRQGVRTLKSHGQDASKFSKEKIMDIGHDAIDAMILAVRKHEIKTLKKLPPPRKD